MYKQSERQGGGDMATVRNGCFRWLREVNVRKRVDGVKGGHAWTWWERKDKREKTWRGRKTPE